jgi:hypothetical protein
MDEFEKWMDAVRDSHYSYGGEWIPYENALAKYRSLKKTCKMMAHVAPSGLTEHECSNCYTMQDNLDRFCSNCGAEVEGSDAVSTHLYAEYCMFPENACPDWGEFKRFDTIEKAREYTNGQYADLVAKGKLRIVDGNGKVVIP